MIVYNGKKIKALNRQNVEIPRVVLSYRINETAITAWEKDCPKPGGAAMIPRRNRELPFGRNSFSFSYKRRYNGNLCACSVQQAKAASSMMTCTKANIIRRRPKQHKNTPPRLRHAPGRQREGKRAFFKRRRALSRPHASGSPRPPP